MMHQKPIDNRIESMTSQLHDLFRTCAVCPPENLNGKIIEHINYLEQRKSIKIFWISTSVCVITTAIFVPVVIQTYHNVAQSGVIQYTSLVFSNGGTFITYWKDFASAIGESIPAMSIALSFGIILAIGGSFKSAITNFNPIKKLAVH